MEQLLRRVQIENPQQIINNITACIYYKYISCVFIHKIHQYVLDEQFDDFIKKYNIQNKDELYSLLTFVKENNTKVFVKFTVHDSQLVGYLLFFIVYYMKNNDLFSYMNRMLQLMLSANKMRSISFQESYIDHKCNNEHYNHDINTDDVLFEESINNQQQLHALLILNKNIENLSINMNNSYVYNIVSNIYHDYDGDVLNFAIVM
jgi:hypothetical protein